MKILNLLLNYTSNLNFETINGQIPLFVAFSENLVDILKVFLDRSFQLLNPQSSSSFSLMKSGINIHIYNEEWENILLYTYKRINNLPYPAFPYLLNYGLSHCYYHGRIFDNYIIDINAHDWNGKSLILMAVEREDCIFLSNFLNIIIDLNAQAIIHILNRLKNGFYHNLVDHHSKEYSTKEIIMADLVKLIKSDYYRLDLEFKDKSQNTPLLQSVWSNNIDIMKCLLHFGAKTEVRNASGFTPLMLASFLGKVEMVKILINFGANVNARRPSSFNLYSYVQHSSHPSYSIHKEEKGETALTLARQNNHESVVQILLKHHAIE